MTAAPVAILTYHRVAPGPDPFLQCTHPDRFDGHMRTLRNFGNAVPLSALDERSRVPRVAVTLDDGYADNATIAAPIMREHQIPATFFVPSRVLDATTEYWWDRLEHHHSNAPSAQPTVDVAVRERRIRIDVRTEGGRLRSLKALNTRLRPLPQSAIEPIVAEVARQLGADPDPTCARHALMSRRNLSDLARDPLFEVGCHGATHTMLSGLPSKELEIEIVESKRLLEIVTESPVTSFAYPYGTPDSCNRDIELRVRRAGYARACLNMPRRLHGRRDRFHMPRFMVYDWTPEEFGERIEGWLSAAPED